MFIGTTRSRGIFHSEAVHPDSVSSFCSYTRKEAVSSVKKTSATPKKARTDRHSRWSKKELCNKTKPHWRPPAGREVGQCSHGKWRSSKLQGKWKEISVEIDAAIDERQEHKERSMLKDKSKQLQKEREEEEEARGQLEEMQRNLDDQSFRNRTETGPCARRIQKLL